MYQLLEDYLNNSEIYWSNKNEVCGWDINGHLCDVRYKETQEDSYTKETQVNIWDVMEYIHSEIKKINKQK